MSYEATESTHDKDAMNIGSGSAQEVSPNQTENYAALIFAVTGLKVRQHAFDQEYNQQQEYKVTTETFLGILPSIRPTLTEEVITEFQEDCVEYTRV